MPTLGTHGDVYVFPHYAFERTMTAIAIAYAEEGFVLAADGRIRLGDESRPNASALALTMETDDKQKIFPITFPHQSLAYAVTGTICDSLGFDLPQTVKMQVEAISKREFDDFRSCLNALGENINTAINEAKRSGTLEFPHTKKKERSQAWIITTLYFCGYFNEFPCFSRVDFFHVERDAQFEINEQSLRGPLVSGSEIVADQMYRDPRDPRFSAFVLERGQSPSLETATQFARGYIEACSSPLGLEVDALICKGIGGHLHMATITKSGFTWVIEPVPQ
jgi:hypothetical protein